MDNRYFLIALLFWLIPGVASAQSENYNLEFAPDIWYNDVDGIRLGARVLGEMEGTFLDGPHRLDAGFWVSTWLPELPVSYYLSFTEPIPAISSFGSEGNVRVRSSIRTGYSQHEISINKRWQIGFDELRFRELSFSFSQEKLFDLEYRPYPQLWQNEWKSLIGGNYWFSEFNVLGKFDLEATVKQNIGAAPNFTIGTLELKQQIPITDNFKLYLRGFSGYASEDAAPEYLFGESYRQPIGWLNNGVTRAKGTLPEPWLDDGIFQIAGNANLRGYTQSDFESLSNGESFQYNFVNTLNAEVEFPNPLDQLIDRSILGDFIDLRSYLFGDVGSLSRDNYQSTPDILVDVVETKADAGLGIQFSINIPDYLGKDRGFALRYEIPLWLSDPETGENNFKFRNLIGIGAIISL